MSNNKKLFTPEEAKSLESVIESLKPEPKLLTPSQTIAAMAKTIEAQRKAGVSDEQILDALAKQGLSVSATTYRNALKPKKEKATKPKVRIAKPIEKQQAEVKKTTAPQNQNMNLIDEDL